MRNIIASLLVLVMVAGCATVDDMGAPLPRQSRTYKLMKLVTYAGAVADLTAHPEHKAAFVAASNGIAALVAQEKWDLTSMAGALSAAGITEVNTPEAMLGLQGGVLLLDMFTKQQVDLALNWQAREIVLGANDGLQLVLSSRFAEPTAKVRIFGGVDPILEHLLNEAVESR